MKGKVLAIEMKNVYFCPKCVLFFNIVPLRSDVLSTTFMKHLDNFHIVLFLKGFKRHNMRFILDANLSLELSYDFDMGYSMICVNGAMFKL